MTINPDTIDLLDIVGKELSDILIGGPVHRNTEIIAVFGFELLLDVGTIEPVLAEPVKVRELLVRKLVELAVRPGRERLADEVVEIEHRVGNVLAFAGHPVGEVPDALQPGMGAYKVRVVDVGIIK